MVNKKSFIVGIRTPSDKMVNYVLLLFLSLYIEGRPYLEMAVFLAQEHIAYSFYNFFTKTIHYTLSPSVRPSFFVDLLLSIPLSFLPFGSV